jgi:tetratricopeptide (TPR) repeat protein
MKVLLSQLLVFACASLACGDIVHLRDGSAVEGDVKKSPGGWTVTGADGSSRRVEADDVASIELRSGASGAAATQAADAKLYSLRRSVEMVNDPARAIERYEQFLATHAGTPAGEEAARDLVTWNHRRAHKLVRAGTEWVTPAERIAIQEKAIIAADEARRLIRAGDVEAAEAAITAALRDDPQNPAALYLRGLLHFQQNQLAAARKSWETVNTLVPNHVATLNNLAVVSWRQNNYPAALKWYDQAMAAAPLDVLVLDNVAEALHAIPPEQRDSTVVQRTLKRFTEQDTMLQKQMAERGLFRWGPQWVDRARLDELKVAAAAHQKQLDEMAREFDEAKERVEKLDAEIDANERSMRQIEANSWIIDRTGRRTQQRLPGIYYELQRDNDTLRRTRIDELAQLDQLRESAKRTQSEAPAPEFTGVQELIETDGTPIAIPDDPTSRATTAPAS